MLENSYLIHMLVSSAVIINANSVSFPPDIIKIREEAFADCRQAGGKPSADKEYVQAADFNGDGRPDYVLDDGRLNCEGASYQWCGTGGCSIELYVSTPGGYRSANLQRLGFGATIKHSSKGPTLTVGGRHGAITYRWNGAALQPIKGR